MNSPLIPDAVRELAVSASDGTGHMPDAFVAAMPKVMRIQSIEHDQQSGGWFRSRAVLFHQRCSICVEWVSVTVDASLSKHALAEIRHGPDIQSVNGALRIHRLVPACQPIRSTNIFETVPCSWIADRELLSRAVLLWRELPAPLAGLVTSIFWDSPRFHRFVMGPSSIGDHHAGWNGNFRHVIEVAEHARDIGRKTPLADISLLIAAGLLHDAAKADEYRYDRKRRAFRMSERGELVGHRDTLIEWMGVARASAGDSIPEETYLALLHTINATKAAPWLGLRDPRCLEAEILSMADRLSGTEDIHERCAPTDGQSGFGALNPRNGRRCYVTSRAKRL